MKGARFKVCNNIFLGRRVAASLNSPAGPAIYYILFGLIRLYAGDGIQHHAALVDRKLKNNDCWRGSSLICARVPGEVAITALNPFESIELLKKSNSKY